MPPTMTKNHTATIWIEKKKITGSVDIVTGDANVVTFHADQKCVLHFKNPGVLGLEYLALKKDQIQDQPILMNGEQTEFDILVPVTIAPSPDTRGPWPIVPKN